MCSVLKGTRPLPSPHPAFWRKLSWARAWVFGTPARGSGPLRVGLHFPSLWLSRSLLFSRASFCKREKLIQSESFRAGRALKPLPGLDAFLRWFPEGPFHPLVCQRGVIKPLEPAWCPSSPRSASAPDQPAANGEWAVWTQRCDYAAAENYNPFSSPGSGDGGSRQTEF